MACRLSAQGPSVANPKNGARRKRKYNRPNDGHKVPGDRKGKLRPLARRERNLTFLLPNREKPTNG